MARRSEHSQEEIKEMVLKAAESIVIEEGFSELKVRKIAMDIGYTVGSIYMVFENMADLIMHIKGRSLDNMTQQLQSQIDEDQAEQVIKNLAKCYYTFAYQHYNRWSMIFEHRLAENETIPSWYQEKIDIIFGLVEHQFHRLSATHTKKESYLAARTLWSGIHGICALSLTGKAGLQGGQHGEDSVALLVDNFIKGWKNT
ncbi:MAG: TetR/AcrR family transcriptional regulator [Methylococcales bacterium]|nr:TetR/AcrR family transcriptional regulator [Methylococcales bacterium]